MIWRIIAAIGAGTFLVTGFSVLTDPNCVTAGFSGSRAVTITCYQDNYGDMSGQAAGLLSISGGVALGALALWPLIANYRRRRMYLNNLDLELQNNIEIQRRIANKDALSKSVETTLNIDQNIENQAMPSKISEQQQESKQCSYCAELINSAAIKCRYCGSSLLPNVSDKLRIQIKKLTPILKKPEIYAVLIVFTVIVFLFVNSNIEKANKLKDIEQLMVSGKVCASGDFGETFGFGCDKYPVVNLEWCSTDQFLRPFWSEEIYGEYVDVYKSNNGIMVGQKDSRCSSPTPFFHQLSTTVKDLPSGDYDLLSVVYRDIDGNEMIENSRSGDFLLRISR